MAKKTTKRNTASPVFRLPKKAKQVTGNANKLKKLNELQKVNNQLEERSKTSSKLFDKRNKLMQQLGMDRDIF